MNTGAGRENTRPRVLVIEDDVDVARAVERILREYEVSLATTATEGIARLSETAWTALIVDIGLPEGDLAGIDVLRAAREQDPALPILVVTGRLASEKATSDAIALGTMRVGAPILPKPVPREDLLAFVRHANALRMPFERYLVEVKRFSPREAEILAWVQRGRTLDAYAASRGLSRATVKSYGRRILRQTGAANLQSVLLAIQRERR